MLRGVLHHGSDIFACMRHDKVVSAGMVIQEACNIVDFAAVGDPAVGLATMTSNVLCGVDANALGHLDLGHDGGSSERGRPHIFLRSWLIIYSKRRTPTAIIIVIASDTVDYYLRSSPSSRTSTTHHSTRLG